MTYAKDRVLRTAGRMFSERGFDSVSMRDLALELNIQAPSLYSHFPSKEALLGGICDPYTRAMTRLLAAPPATLTGLLDGWRDILNGHVDAVRIVHGDPAVRQLSVGKVGWLHDQQISALLERFGVPSAYWQPLIAAFRAPWSNPFVVVNLPSTMAAGRLIIQIADQARAVA